MFPSLHAHQRRLVVSGPAHLCVRGSIATGARADLGCMATPLYAIGQRGHLTVRVTRAPCVDPPVAGARLPNLPVKVRVYVPFVVLLLVSIAAVLSTLLDPPSDKELREIVYGEPGGTPPQESAAVPVNAPIRAKLIS